MECEHQRCTHILVSGTEEETGATRSRYKVTGYWRLILRAIGKVLYNGDKKKNPRVSGMTRLTSIAENVVLPHRQEDVERTSFNIYICRRERSLRPFSVHIKRKLRHQDGAEKRCSIISHNPIFPLPIFPSFQKEFTSI